MPVLARILDGFEKFLKEIFGNFAIYPRNSLWHASENRGMTRILGVELAGFDIPVTFP